MILGRTRWGINKGRTQARRTTSGTPPRNAAGNPASPQAVIFLASITDVMMGS